MTAALPKQLRARATAAALTVPPPPTPRVCDRCRTGTPIDDALWCPACEDASHPFTQDPDARDGFCVCGRIEHVGFYSPVHEGLTDDDR